jgi:hypothetical protein
MFTVGELGKTLSPSKCRIAKIHETGLRNSCRRRVHIYGKRAKWRVLTSFGCFASSWMVEQGPCIRTFDPFQDMQFLRKSGTWKSWKSGIRKSRKYGIGKSWESGDRGPAKPWNHRPMNLRIEISEIRESRMEDSGISRKPSQRRYLKSPGLACELVEGL